QSFPVVIRTKNGYLSFLISIGFYAFKNGLSVMKKSSSGAKTQIAVGDDLRCVPVPFFIVGNKHVVGIELSKLKIVGIHLLDSGRWGFVYLDFRCCNIHKLKDKIKN